MIDEVIKGKLRESFPNLHPLIFFRSTEYANSPGELFDMLYEANTLELPIVWDYDNRKWVKIDINSFA
jgi:hypothetical protein